MIERLAVVAFPVLAASGRERLDAIRARYDPQAAMLGPHFSLVFPLQCAVEELVVAVASTARRQQAFGFTLREIRAVRDPFRPAGGHLFLLPDEGADRIRALHDELYRGRLAVERRADIPYMPHITVGAASEFERCESIAEALGRHWTPIDGRVEALTILRIVGGDVATVKDEPLVCHE